MRAFILFLAWVTPAIIAGMLGWKGIWGSGSAFFEYLIPIPVAGGVFHVPSFVIAALVILNLKKLPDSFAQLVPLIAIGVFLAAQSLQLDFDRLNAWFFTDYDPSRSPFRFRGNPFYLFVATDALWVALYALVMGYSRQWKFWLLLPLVPVAIIGLEAFSYKTSGPQFTYGFSGSGKTRGDEITMVYTPNTYDEKLFREWLENDSIVSMPWDRTNAEHLAVYFSRSMQAIKWGKMDDVDNIVATFCIFEEDRSITSHAGYHDCFADRLNLSEKLDESFNATDTGFGKEVDSWFSMAKLCDGVEVPERFVSDIAIMDLCRGLKQNYPKVLERIAQQHGDDSDQVLFIKSNASLIGITNTD